MTTRRAVLTSAAALGGAAVLGGCNGLTMLNRANALVPGDGGVVRRIDGAVYGDGPRRRLDIYAPAAAAAPAPVLVFFYGGGWSSGDRGGYAFVARAFAARGFVVVVPDYRLVPQVRFSGFVDDGAAAVRWTVANIAGLGGDPRRIAVAGHSAGAYIAMMLALDARYLAAAGVPGTIKAVVGFAGPYDFLPLDVTSSINAFASAPDLRATQPISFVRGDAPPALLLTGDADDVVRPRNSIALAAALERAGASATLRTYPGVGHVGLLLALSKPFRGRADALAASVAFLRRTLA